MICEKKKNQYSFSGFGATAVCICDVSALISIVVMDNIFSF